MIATYSFKTRFVNPIRVGLGLPPIFQIGKHEVSEMEAPIRPKRQTIRAIGKRRHAFPGDTIRTYWGMRTKGCFLIGEARCKSAREITLTFGRLSGVTVRAGNMRDPDDRGEITEAWEGNGLDTFAIADGFENWAEMVDFWKQTHGLTAFIGVLIRWEPTA